MPIKLLLLLTLLIGLPPRRQEKTTLIQNGWLIYRYGDDLAFLPIRDQSITPTYDNFFTEEKGDGQRMNNNYSAPPKLLMAKRVRVGVYKYDSQSGQEVYAGKEKFLIQPVRYVYEGDPKSDTADAEHGLLGWTFRINGKPMQHRVYFFMYRSGTVHFLHPQDSIAAEKHPRRRTIPIYPPH